MVRLVQISSDDSDSSDDSALSDDELCANYVRSNKIWEGIFDSQTNKISWVEMGFRLKYKRYNHFSFVISNEIITFGGNFAFCDSENDRVEIIQGNKLRQGPKVPFEIDAKYDQAILDRKNRIIIISKYNGFIIYDHKKRTFKRQANSKLRKAREDPLVAILQ